MAQIFVTRAIPEVGIDQLKQAGHQVTVSTKDGVLTKAELIEALAAAPYEAVLCLLTDQIDDQVLAAAPQAKIFANYAVGYDNIDIEAAGRRGIIITNTPGVLTETVAEHTIALMLAAARRIPEADQFTKAGRYEGWAPMLFLGTDLSEKTLGIVGLGRIGAKVAHFAGRGLNMKVAYYDVNRQPEFEDEYGAVFAASVDELLPQADFITLHVPLLDSTKHLINADRLAQMKPTAILVNTSRGPIIDEMALVQALKDKIITAAALDVFEEEPALAAGLADLPNVILTPHIASASAETRGAMATIAAENILAVFSGKTPPNPVG